MGSSLWVGCLELDPSAMQSLHALAVCRADVHQASDVCVSADLYVRYLFESRFEIGLVLAYCRLQK